MEDSVGDSHIVAGSQEEGRATLVDLVVPAPEVVPADQAERSSSSLSVSKMSRQRIDDNAVIDDAQSEGRQRKYPHGFALSEQVCD